MAEAGLTRRGRIALSLGLVLALAASVVWTAWAYYLGGESGLGPAQPIPFSHRVHVTDKQIDCRFCHSAADRGPQAGVPPLETCMFCHRSVIVEHEEIRKLWGFYERGEPVPWVRVFDVPDHVYFTHRMHLRQELDCAECHGEIGAEDRVTMPEEFLMGFCIRCHKSRRGPMDCVACHR